jgi:hypothetical protein
MNEEKTGKCLFAHKWLVVTQMFRNGKSSHGGDRKTFEVMIST